GRRGETPYLETVAFLAPGGDALAKGHHVNPLLADLGYRLDPFAVPPEEAGQHSLDLNLRARGIRGLLVESDGRDISKIRLDWKQYAVVGHGLPSSESVFHNVLAGSFQCAYQATDHVLVRGYRRPGLLLQRRWHLQFLGGYEARVKADGAVADLAPLLFDGEADWEKNGSRQLRAWLKKTRPDVVISPFSDIPMRALNHLGSSVPGDIAYCGLDVQSGSVSGMIQDREACYALMVDMLHGMLTRNDLGIPARAICAQLNSSWNEGDTCPALD
ncbi:MAG: hypothetical protein WD490_03170, partial [Opitutales bacterium]